MKQTGNKYHKNLAAIIIVLALSGFVIGSHLIGALDYVELKAYDLRINFLKHTHRRSQDIVLVLLEQDSLDWAQQERGWPWPWPRKAYAELVDYMNLCGAKSIAFDVLFSEPSIYDYIGGRGDDASFAEAAERYGKVAQVVMFSNQTGSVYSWPADLDKPLFKPENFGSDIFRFDLLNDDSYTGKMPGAQLPIKELRNSAGVVGNVTGQSDSDSIFRRLRLFTIFDGKAVPSLAAASFLAAGYGENISYNPAKKLLHWGDYSIPVDKNGKTLLRFRGPLFEYPVYNISLVLQSAEYHAAGKEIPPTHPGPEEFRDAFVFFGYYAQGLFDILHTPISSTYAGMGVHVTMLDNLLMGDFIQEAPDCVAMLVIAGVILLVVILVLFSGRVSVSLLGLVFSFAAVIVTGFLAFDAGWWIPIAAPAVAVLLAFLTATLYSYATEGKDKRFIKNAFSRILSPKVIDQIIADPSQLKLGGERRSMTAVFTDIQSFSSISSELQDHYGEDGPKVLVNLLNLYLTEMSNIVFANGGTIDKYEGDAIIAFFGAPVWMKEHAIQACRSAVQMKKREKELVESIMNPGGEFFDPLARLIESRAIRKERPLYTRLGINSGEMVVGFMGTPAKMDYTIMGNAVNLAARLEGVNKQYNTKGILISEYTRSRIGDEFIIRPLSRVTVVGIPVPLRLFELLELGGEAPPEMLEMVKAWEEAFKIYEKRNFIEAKKVFLDIFQKDPEDTTAKFYLERCEKFIASPPHPGWDGVDNLTEK